MTDNLIVLQHFFEVDNRIKRELYSNVPPRDNEYLDQESLRKYTDVLYDSLLYIFSELKCVAKDLFGIDSDVFKRIDNLEKSIKNKFYECGFNIDKLRAFYKNYISNMDAKFIDTIKENCVGYYVYKNTDSINMANTINEVLHFLHSYILNNEEILQSTPLIAKKEIGGYPVSLRGIASTIFMDLYNNFPLDLDVGMTDMVVVDEKRLLMMVRDRGHALTIEISLDKDIAKIEYFIPKICNIDMVNSLPGVHKVNKDSIGTTGMFEVNVGSLSNVLFDFISKVPTDDDMIYERKSK